MLERHGDIWSQLGKGLVCVTTNSVVKSNGELVMGAGIAREAKERLPWLPIAAGYQVRKSCGSGGRYGLIVIGPVGLFQSKTHWKLPSDLKTIELATDELQKWATAHRHVPIHVNFPGINHGKLTRDEVYPIIERLPDQVTVWSYR